MLRQCDLNADRRQTNTRMQRIPKQKLSVIKFNQTRWGPYSAPQTPYLDFRGLLLRGGKGKGEGLDGGGGREKGGEEMYSSTTYFRVI